MHYYIKRCIVDTSCTGTVLVNPTRAHLFGRSCSHLAFLQEIFQKVGYLSIPVAVCSARLPNLPAFHPATCRPSNNAVVYSCLFPVCVEHLVYQTVSKHLVFSSRAGQKRHFAARKLTTAMAYHVHEIFVSAVRSGKTTRSFEHSPRLDVQNWRLLQPSKVG